MNLPKYSQYWAKTAPGSPLKYHLLPYHLLDVAAVVDVYLCQHPGLLRHWSSRLDVDEALVQQLLVFFALLHDIGKFSPRFQALAPELFDHLQQRTYHLPYKPRHDSLGFLVWYNMLLDDMLSQCDEDTDEYDVEEYLLTLAHVGFGHHGQVVETSHYAGNYFQQDEDLEALKAFVDDVLKCIISVQPLHLTSEHVHWLRAHSWAMAGLMVLCDWVGSDPLDFPYEDDPNIPMLQYWQRARTQAQNALQRKGLLPPVVAESDSWSTLFPEFETMRPAQQWAQAVEITTKPQLFIIEDETGSGKTETALLLAHRILKQTHANGFYFGLPTMATANAMYERLVDVVPKFYEPDVPVFVCLGHGRAHLHDEYKALARHYNAQLNNRYYDKDCHDEMASSQASAWLSDRRKLALIAHVGVGTIDQALLGVLPVRHQSLRTFGLQQKVLILDEVHAYDIYTSILLEQLITLHTQQGGHTILLTATLPHQLKARLTTAFDASAAPPDPVPYPCASVFPVTQQARHLAHDGQQCTFEFVHQVDDAFDYINTLPPDQCVCWIRNTVQDAIDAYEHLQQSVSPERLLLFHSRFTHVDRAQLEETIIDTFGKRSDAQRRAGKILIATQVVEQSLDIDFDHMISDLAPIDSIIQRIGRLHRHPRTIEGQISHVEQRPTKRCVVLAPKLVDTPCTSWYGALFPRGQYVYARLSILYKTLAILEQKKTIDVIDDARELMEFVYAPDDEALWEELERQVKAKTQAKQWIAYQNRLNVQWGYHPQSNAMHWFDETRTPTRLSEPSVTLRLACIVDDRVVPLHHEHPHGWHVSEVTLPAYQVEQTCNPEQYADALGKAIEQMSDQARYSQVLLMEFHSGRWQGHGVDSKQRDILMTYDGSGLLAQVVEA